MPRVNIKKLFQLNTRTHACEKWGEITFPVPIFVVGLGVPKKKMYFLNKGSLCVPLYSSPLGQVRMDAEMTLVLVSGCCVIYKLFFRLTHRWYDLSGLPRGEKIIHAFYFIGNWAACRSGQSLKGNHMVLVDKRPNIQNTLPVICFSPLVPFSLVSWRMCPRGKWVFCR